jgi:predicted nucleic acid-binding Zn ribbon protein
VHDAGCCSAECRGISQLSKQHVTLQKRDTTTILLMALIILTLLIITIHITPNMHDIKYNDIAYD